MMQSLLRLSEVITSNGEFVVIGDPNSLTFNNFNTQNTKYPKFEQVTWGKEYQINSHYDSTNGRRYYSLINDRGIGNDYNSDRFVTKEEFRTLQLNKLGI